MLLFAVALLAAADPADQAGAPAQPTEAPEPTKKAKKICKADDITSGSRMGKRLCLTEDEWAQRANGMTNSARSGFSGKAEDH